MTEHGLFLREGDSSAEHNDGKKGFMPEPTFPEVFTNPNFEYSDIKHFDAKQTKRLACADGLMGWSLCMFGNKPPKTFGEGMVKIGEILKEELGNKGATADELMKVSEKLKP